MKLVFAATILACVLTLPSRFALAWGDLGHRVICEIAFQELTPATKTEVNRLIQLDDDFRTFSRSCTWPDRPRIRRREHYVNLPRDAIGFGAQPCPVASKCVISAIMNDIRDLAFTGDDLEKLRLLKSLGHWIGDVHQPLHVSFADDRGGNKIDVDFPCHRNLHSVWDTCIIQRAIGRGAYKIAEDLRAEITDDDRQRWIPNEINLRAVMDWAEESFAITRSPEVRYCVQKGDECWYSDEQREFSDTEKSVNADEQYLLHHASNVQQRLQRAGIRLAAILNQLFRQNN